jgi:putative peptidoglycan lipid II flippase
MGTALGFAAQAILLWAGNSNLRMSFAPNWYGIRRSSLQIGRQYSPMLAATLLHNSSMLVDQTMAANLGSGSLTVLNYSGSVIFAFLSIGSSVVGTVFLPHFSAMIARGGKPEAINMLKVYSIVVLLGSIPVAAAIFLFAEPIVRLVFERGEFSRNDTIIVSQVVQMYSVQIPFYLLGILGVRFLSAELNNAFTFRISLMGAILNIVLNFLFIELMGLKGIALSTSIVYAVTTSLIFAKIVLNRYIIRPQEIL